MLTFWRLSKTDSRAAIWEISGSGLFFETKGGDKMAGWLYLNLTALRPIVFYAA